MELRESEGKRIDINGQPWFPVPKVSNTILFSDASHNARGNFNI
jgi:hypothetical protein